MNSTPTLHDSPVVTPYAPTIAALNEPVGAHRTEEARVRAAEAVRLALVGAERALRRWFMNNPGSRERKSSLERGRFGTAALSLSSWHADAQRDDSSVVNNVLQVVPCKGI